MEAQTADWISQALTVFMFLGLIAVYGERTYRKKGIGARTIQMTGIVMLVPLVGILSLQKVLEPQTTATLIGAFIGYLLSGIGSNDSSKSD